MSRASFRARRLAPTACALALAWVAASVAPAAESARAPHGCAAHAASIDEPPPEPLECFICAGDARLHEAWLRATLRTLVAAAHAAGHSLR